MIDGVDSKRLDVHKDERGFFCELARLNDNFFEEGVKQISHSMVFAGVAKAWHVHETQIDWWYVPVGNLKVALFDGRRKSKTYSTLNEFFIGQDFNRQIIKIPAGVLHGCKAIGMTTHLIYFTSKTYDKDEEGRVSHADRLINYDWVSLPEIK